MTLNDPIPDALLESRAPPEPSAEDASRAFMSFVHEVFNPAWYLARNPGLDADPLTHWLEHGYRERRPPSPYVLVDRGSEIDRERGGWQHFIWKGESVRLLKIDPAEHQAFLSVAGEVFDPVWYLANNPDVAGSDLDPLTHWLDHGVSEGRDPGPYCLIARRRSDAWTGPGWRHLTWRGQSVRLLKVNPADQDAFLAFVEGIFDPKWYLANNPDVAASGLDPLEHWLKHGAREGRPVAPGASVRFTTAQQKPGGGQWRRFAWRGEQIEIRLEPVSKAVLAQVIAQAKNDPAVLAAGSLTLPNLPSFDALDELPRNGVDIAEITRFARREPKIVLFLPHLVVGGADKYAVDLLAVLRKAKKGPILVIVTETTEAENPGWKTKEVFRIYQEEQLMFWRDVCGPAYSEPSYLAFFMNCLRPHTIVVSNSHRGLEMISRYGRGLSAFARLFTTYFSLGFPGLGVTWGTRYARRTAPFARSITDNRPTERRLLQWYGSVPGPGVAVVPSHIDVAEDALFEKRLEARWRSTAARSATGKWLWISRIERFKGTATLAALAKLRPNDIFYLFGPTQEPLADQGLEQPNIRYGGLLPSIPDADLSPYDGFLFTSLFEGLPLIALEMSQHAIPMILADVGGLRDTFDDTSAIFVPDGHDTEQAARALSAALDRVSKMDGNEIVEMVTRARSRAVQRHGQAEYERAVRELFCHVE